MTVQPLLGLVAAPHTPFDPQGQLRLAAVEDQASFLTARGVAAVFICGSTGECHSLTLHERAQLCARWIDATRGTPLRVVVHVGSNCLREAAQLATHAADLGAHAIAACAPSYFKPKTIEVLIDCCAEIATAASRTPFYFYDIPALTGVALSMPEFLERAPKRIPTLVGLKFTNPDLVAYQRCVCQDRGRWDLPWGLDEILLAALALGARGAVGSGFNFAAPIYRRLLAHHEAGNLEAARREQARGLQLVRLLEGFGYLGAGKALMGLLGVPVGPARLPNTSLSTTQTDQLQQQLGELGFFDWIKG
jgi:N-acetylneuraminate lyase